MVRLVHKDAPGYFDPLNEDQEAIFRSQGWTDEKPARKPARKKAARSRRSPQSSEPASASGSSKPDGSSPADTERE